MNVYEIITSRIIELLDSGIVPWHKPWHSEESAYNFVSRRPYSFLNQMLLPMKGAFLTRKQIDELGASIRKGESPSKVVFFKIVGKDELDEDGTEKKAFPLLRYYQVWHVSQVDGIDLTKVPTIDLDDSLEPIDDCEELFLNYVTASGVNFCRRKGNDASYNEHTDTVNMPLLGSFESSEEYYSTLFHELVHSTAAESRLSRVLSKDMESKEYAKEELVAEMGSAMLCSFAEIDTLELQTNQAAYCKYWRDRFASDPSLFVTAAGRAEKAARFILNDKAA